MFYDEFVALCAGKGVSRTKACTDCGVSRTAWHKWENGATPNGATLNKFAEYFGVSVSRLLGEHIEEAPTPEGERHVSDAELKAAFFDGYSDELTQEEIDELWADAKDYARFKAEQRMRHKE